MRAFGRGKQRALSVGGVAVALAASLAGAEAAPAPALPADRGARLPLLSPEAAPSLGEVGDASPLVAVFNAARAAGDGAPSLTLFISPKLDFTPVGEIAPSITPRTRTVPRGRRTTRPGASTTLRRPPSRRRRSARFRKGQALKTIRAGIRRGACRRFVIAP